MSEQHPIEIPYGHQFIDAADIAAVEAVLRSDYLTQGPAIERFERKVAEYCGARHAVAVSSATAALHLGALALGVKPGDYVLTSAITFVASANCARYCGANVLFVDIEPGTANLCPFDLEQKLTYAWLGEWPVRVIVPVHLAGQSCNMQAIHALARYYNVAVMEDAAHALGGRYQGRPVGGCQYSDLAVFSFHPVKIITTGEGGVITTNREDLYEQLLRLRSHGITRDPRHLQNPVPGPWYYEQIELGYNYRMTDLQAALGASQMDKLDTFVRRRRELADRYEQLLRGLPVTPLARAPEAESSWHLYIIRLNLKEIKKPHAEVFRQMRRQGIGVQLHYIPVFLQPYYKSLNAIPCPQALEYYQEAMTLPLYYGMTEAQQDRVVEALKRALQS
ncbi:MAG: UDP-4-amino-4,6-dideoxy-N-acetyl-beta-L-altrosamine transaminase [Verrucomicrobiae bacterium]|nr:UDP-4-amino-4,6-dideoxy-N-acetyl-beta-L-altrosamine transaminase [Verrucomicrobiae bacterium]